MTKPARLKPPPRCPQCITLGDGRMRCDECKAATRARRQVYAKAWHVRRYHKARAQGICARCGDPAPGKWACVACMGDDRERFRAKKREAVECRA